MHLKVDLDFFLHLTNIMFQAIRLEKRGESASNPLMILSNEFQEASVAQDHPHRVCLLVAQFAAVSREHEPVGGLTVNEDSWFAKEAELRNGAVSSSSISHPFLGSVGPHSPQKAKALTDEWDS